MPMSFPAPPVAPILQPQLSSRVLTNVTLGALGHEGVMWVAGAVTADGTRAQRAPALDSSRGAIGISGARNNHYRIASR